jgi:acetyl-CoA carboxylase biotin carboxyl carrier protein
MAEKTLIAKIRADEQDPELLVVASPVVGMADGVPRVGIFLNPFDRLLTIKILDQSFTLRMPRDVHGRITEACIPNALTPVAYDDPLVRIDPRALAAGEGGAELAAASASGGEAAAAGAIAVPAPSEGIFYRSSSPDSDPYVQIGSQVSTGTVLGLVEVMKCFNQITYGGPGLPEKGEVVKILADDSAEVHFGQELFWVKPSE